MILLSDADVLDPVMVLGVIPVVAEVSWIKLLRGVPEAKELLMGSGVSVVTALAVELPEESSVRDSLTEALNYPENPWLLYAS